MTSTLTTPSPRPLASPPANPQEMMGGLGDATEDSARAAARARLAARAAHVEGGMAAQAAAEAAVEAVSGANDDDENEGVASSMNGSGRSVFSRLQRGSQLVLGDVTNAMQTPGGGVGLAMGKGKRKHIFSPPTKFCRRKGHAGTGINVARAARDLCGDLGEPKESLMRRAIETIGVVVANDIAIEVGRIEGEGGQMTTDGSRRRTPGGVFWALLKARVSKEDWDYIFAEEKEVQRERCRRRRRAASLAAASAPSSLAGSPAVVLKTPAPPFRGGLDADGLEPVTRFAGAYGADEGDAGGIRTVDAAGAPSRPTLAERLSGSATAGRLVTGDARDTPIGAKVMGRPGLGSWADRARAAAAVQRAQSAPASELRAALNDDASDYSPSVAAAALTLTSPAHASGKRVRDHAMQLSPAYGLVTPDNDTAAEAAKPGGTWAARAKAAAEAEVAAAAQLRARARAVQEAKLKSAKTKQTAPAAGKKAEVTEDAAMEPEDDGEAKEMVAKPASIWAGMASFASMVRAA